MRLNFNIILYFFIVITLPIYAQEAKILSLENVLDDLSLKSPAAKIVKLSFQNELLQFENFKKSFLPSVSFTMNPMNFNRSLKLMQNYKDGSYSYVEDYSGSSTAGIVISQKVSLTGGTITMGSNLNYLRQYSNKSNSFNSIPFSVNYSQQFFWGK